MEPAGLIIGFLLFFGYSLLSVDSPQNVQTAQVEVEHPQVTTVNVFERGRFYRSTEGYYISNLTPEPELVKGCELPVLIADLNATRTADAQLQVTEIDVGCEG